MANGLKNDRGEWVTAIGAPGSRERIKCQYPMLISDIEKARDYKDEPGSLDEFPFSWMDVEGWIKAHKVPKEDYQAIYYFFGFDDII